MKILLSKTSDFLDKRFPHYREVETLEDITQIMKEFSEEIIIMPVKKRLKEKFPEAELQIEVYDDYRE